MAGGKWSVPASSTAEKKSKSKAGPGPPTCIIAVAVLLALLASFMVALTEQLRAGTPVMLTSVLAKPVVMLVVLPVVTRTMAGTSASPQSTTKDVSQGAE